MADTFEAGMVYGTGDNSTVGTQLNTFYWQKKALIEAAKEQYFTQLADVTAMPRNAGKTIKQYLYVPLLDDRNLNDQGIDAAGVIRKELDDTGTGNLYGSSKDVGKITERLPLLSEQGGRVNRVGFTRKTLEGTIQNFGFFSEYTEDSVQFDSDDMLQEHIQRETLTGATQITEAVLQKDIVNAAGVIRYAGAATSLATVDESSVVTYDDIIRLGIDLDNNRTPKSTTIITGTRFVDTKVVGATRVMYIGSELLPTLLAMKDLHGEAAFKPVESYAAGTTVLNGEAGAIGAFRIVVVPEMQKQAGKGGASASGAFYATGGKADVFPMLVVGDKSFTTIGFQTDGKTVKFKQIHQQPGATSANRHDPYGKTGFISIQWWYGFMALRPERIAVIYTAAKL